MTNDDPPLSVKLLAKAMLFMLIIPMWSSASPVVIETNLPTSRLVLIRGNSVVGLTSPGSDSLTGIPLLDKIIEAESSNRWWIKNPHSSAYGYCQITKGTREYVEKKWQMKINWKDPQQQIYACKRLFLEEGTRHWNESKSKWDK